MTMPARIELVGEAGSLVLRRDEGGLDWWQVELGGPGRVRPLGADHLDDIVARLADFLRSGSPGPRWVLSLFELHTSIYGEHLGEQTVLRVQDRDAASFATLVLTPAQRQAWLEALAAAGARRRSAMR